MAVQRSNSHVNCIMTTKNLDENPLENGAS